MLKTKCLRRNTQRKENEQPTVAEINIQTQKKEEKKRTIRLHTDHNTSTGKHATVRFIVISLAARWRVRFHPTDFPIHPEI